MEPPEWFVQEFKIIRAMEFHYLDENAITENTKYLAESLARHEPKDVVMGDLLIPKWEPEEVKRFVGLMKPDLANFMILSKGFTDFCNRVEPHFGTKFSVESKRE